MSFDVVGLLVVLTGVRLRVGLGGEPVALDVVLLSSSWPDLSALVCSRSGISILLSSVSQ